MDSPQLAPGQAHRGGARALDALPCEVAAVVAAHLDQYDCARLAVASRAMYAACMPRLCSTVVVDPGSTPYDRDIPSSLSCTYINLTRGLRRFLRVAPRVHALRVVALPDLMSVHDEVLARALAAFLRAQTTLRELVWTPPSFQWAWLAHLSQTDMLQVLDISMAATDAAAAAAADIEDKNGIRGAGARFCNLLRFRLSSPVLLAQFGRLEGACAQVRSLVVDRALQIRVWPPATELARNPTADLDVDTVRCVLTSPRPLLVDLTLSGVLVCEADAALLQDAVCLPQLQRLVLHQVAECGPRTGDGFLLAVAKHLHHIRELHLDFREGAQDTVAPALNAIATRAPLAALALVVRVNNAKLIYSDADHIYKAHARAVAAFPCLQKLSLKVCQELAFCDLIVPTPDILGRSMGRLRLLQKLQLHALTTNLLVEWLAPLDKLRFLDVRDTRDVHVQPTLVMGETVVGPREEIQQIAQQHFQANPSLISIRIDNTVFGVDRSTANVQSDASFNWFDHHMSGR